MANLSHSKLAFIGAGKMAEALIKGLCKSQALPPSHIVVSDKKSARRKHLSSSYGVKPVSENRAAVAGASVIILAVKPQDMQMVLAEISPYVTKFQLVISIAAGVTLEFLQKKLKKIPLVRAMPNNPAMVGAGVTALSHGKFSREIHLKIADSVFKSVGENFFIPEKLMDGVTALSGSGPAFVYLFFEGLLAGAQKSKLPFPTAKRLALRMMEGAIQTIEQTGRPLKQLREMVASKGGTTEAGLKVLKRYKFKKAVEETVLAAARRSKELNQ